MPNPLRADPTRTTTLRKTYLADMTRRFKAIKRAVTELIVTDDVFGLKPRLGALTANQEPRAWEFATDEQKLLNFNAWLQVQLDSNVLETDGNAWTSKYVQEAYERGSTRAVHQVASEAPLDPVNFPLGPTPSNVATSFLSQPERLSKVQFLASRSFEELKGISAVTSQQLNRILADGLIAGLGPREIARQINAQIGTITKTRALTLARTEVIAAHAEGQLDSFEDLGIEDLGVEAEWKTAGDERVCPLCRPLDGQVFTVEQARGLLPRHPNCRCAWLPIFVDEDDKAERRASTRKAIRESASQGPDSDRWLGPNKRIN